MKFSIVIPAFLGQYKGAAADREIKIVRAINSCFMQSFRDFEVIVVADGCEKTVEIVSHIKQPGLSLYHIPKCKTWSGVPRNTGIDNAQGEYIVYLDIDDILGRDHLLNISKQIDGFDWVWFDDIRYHVNSEEWYQNPCNITKLGECGTSNICHKKSMSQRWIKDGYAHDYHFIKSLRLNPNYAKIEGAEYFVCHIPGTNSGGPKGYDL